jgi:protein gp37
MGENSKIEWTDHTFNPWRGCTKVSEGCRWCYGERQAHRNPELLGYWGMLAGRVMASEKLWNDPIRWDRKAQDEGVRRRVFCGSMCDVFEDRPETREPRHRLLDVIQSTPSLDWLLLTKRPTFMSEWIPTVSSDFAGRYPNVWLGVSVEDQRMADHRIPLLLKSPARVRFLSVEPLLEPVDLKLAAACDRRCSEYTYAECPGTNGPCIVQRLVDWVIVGGESGPNARPCDLAWVRSIVQQCRAAGVPVFVKQLGSRPVEDGRSVPLTSLKGGKLPEWPEDLRIREFPR